MEVPHVEKSTVRKERKLQGGLKGWDRWSCIWMVVVTLGVFERR